MDSREKKNTKFLSSGRRSWNFRRRKFRLPSTSPLKLCNGTKVPTVHAVNCFLFLFCNVRLISTGVTDWASDQLKVIIEIDFEIKRCHRVDVGSIRPTRTRPCANGSLDHVKKKKNVCFVDWLYFERLPRWSISVLEGGTRFWYQQFFLLWYLNEHCSLGSRLQHQTINLINRIKQSHNKLKDYLEIKRFLSKSIH